jgi:tetratricopeptide (TPR) repeat protein
MAGSHAGLWRTPSPPLVSMGEAPPVSVVREAGPLAPALWRCLQIATLWAAAGPVARRTLFPSSVAETLTLEAAQLPPPAREAALDLARMLATPRDDDRETLARVCTALSGWAAGSYMPAAAADLAAAAASAVPESAGYAGAAAVAFRRAGRHSDATAMYGRTVVLSRLDRDWSGYLRAHAALGQVGQLRGDLSGARRSLLRALRRTGSRAPTAATAPILHELHRLEVRAGREDAAQAWAVQAADAYPPADEGLRELAAEAAGTWMRAGKHGDALPVLKRLAERSSGPARHRLLGWISRAAATLGDESAARAAARELMELPLHEGGRGMALLEAAEGMLALGLMDEAESAARAALGTATRLEEPAVVDEARSILTRAAARRALGPAPTPRSSSRPAGALSQALAAALDRAPSAA